MTYLDLYKAYSLELKFHMSDVIHVKSVEERSADHLSSTIKYWTKVKLHRLYVSKMDVFQYGYIDLVTGKIVPSIKDMSGDKLSKEDIDRNLTIVKKTWENVLLFFITRLKEKTLHMQETLLSL